MTTEEGRCDCGQCERGILSAGHCISIDGEPWHDCRAWDAEVAVGRARRVSTTQPWPEEVP